MDKPVAAPQGAAHPMSRWLSHQIRRLLAISASLVSTYVITGALGLIFWTVAARRLSISEVGVAGAAVAMMTLLGGFGSLGLGSLLILKFPQTPQATRRLLVRTSLAIAAVASFALAIVVATVIRTYAVGSPTLQAITDSPLKIVLLAASTSLATVALILDQAVLVLGVGTLQMQRNIVASVVKLLALFAMPTSFGGMAVFAAWSLGTLASLPVIAFSTRGGRPLEAAENKLVDLSILRSHVRETASNYGLNTILVLPVQMLPIIVGIVLSQRDNGLFTATLRISEVCFVLPYALSVGLFASSEGNPRSLLRQMRVSLPMALGVCLLASITAFVAAPLLLALFGSAYSEDAATLLKLVVLASIGFAVKDHFVALKRVQDRTASATLFFLGFCLVELTAATIGAKTAGLTGLVVAWLAIVAVEAAVMLVALLRDMRRWPAADGEAPPLESIAPEAPAPAALALAAPAPEALAPVALAPVAPVPDAPVPDAPEADAPAPKAPAMTDNALARFLTRQGVGLPLFVVALGLLAYAAGIAQARDLNTGIGITWYLVGLGMMFVPAVVAALLPGLGHPFRRWVPLAMLVALQLTRVIQFPSQFTEHDELAHATNLEHVLTSGHLYGANPILPVTAYYPGLAVAADAVAQLTGLSAHTSGLIVTFLARVIFGVALYGIVATVARSARVGGAAVVVYACAPQTLMFNSQYAYQTLALPLALLAVYFVVRRHADGLGGLVPPILVTMAVALTHHLTSLALIGLWAGWLVITALRRRWSDRWARTCLELAAMLAVAVAAVVGVAFLPGNVMVTYLGQAFDNAVTTGLAALEAGQTKRLFVNPAGLTSTLAEKIAMASAIALTGLGLLVGWWRARAWLRRRNAALALLLILLSGVFVLEPVGHVVQSTAEIADRSTSFAFLGIAFVLGWWAWSRRMSLRRAAGLGLAVVIMFAGGVMLGAGPMVLQVPGRYYVGADNRTVDRDNVAAAAWLGQDLPAGSRVFADRVGMLLAAEAGAMPLTQGGSGIDASDLLLAPQVTGEDEKLIRTLRIQYLMVDERDSSGLPNLGIYVTGGEFGLDDRTAPVPLSTLRKFAAAAGASQVYTNGSMTIYNVEGVHGG